MGLRHYQTEALSAWHEAMNNGHRAGLIVMDTGLGKTETFLQALVDRTRKGRSWIAADRRFLVQQTWERANRRGIAAEIEMGDQYAHQEMFVPDCVVTCVDSMVRMTRGQRRMERFRPQEFATGIIDEAHHSVAAKYRTFIDYFKHDGFRLYGTTATPNRTDERALGMVYDCAPYTYCGTQPLLDGWILPVEALPSVEVDIDWDKCSASPAREFNAKALDREMAGETPVHKIAAPVYEYLRDKKTLIFCAGIEQSRRLAEVLNRYATKDGLPPFAASIDYKVQDAERQQIMSDYRSRSGAIRHLCNVNIIGEGVDVVDIEAIVLASPSRSAPVVRQRIGRGLRPHVGELRDGKWHSTLDDYTDATQRRAVIADSKIPTLIVLDLVAALGQAKIVSSVEALAGNYDEDIIRLAEREIRTNPRLKVHEALIEAEKLIREERLRKQERMREGMVPTYKITKGRTVDPYDLLDLTPPRAYGFGTSLAATPKQQSALTKFFGKLSVPEEVMADRKRASQVLGTLFGRSKQGLASPSQLHYLRQQWSRIIVRWPGMAPKGPQDITRKEARAIFDELWNKKR